MTTEEGERPDPLKRISTALAVVIGCFVFYTAALGPYDSLIQRAIFLALVIVLGLTVYPLWAGTARRRAGMAIDAVLGAVSVAACASIVIRYEEIMTSFVEAAGMDQALTVGLVVTILELARRSVGIIFPLLVLVGLGYALFGHLIDGALGHRGFDVYFVTETIFLGDLGVWGMLLGIASTVIAAFILFGALLLHTGGGQAFMDLAMRLGGRSPGGAAKVGTIASGFFGMVSGSAVANVATTGNFTIPMMRRLGYPAPFAAAVEAVASTGGQIAPPIMGAAAFVMAEILGVSYVTVMLAAVLPAVLFYGSVFMTVHVVARRRELALVPGEDLPSWSRIAAPRNSIPFIAAMAGLIVGILLGRSVATAAFYGIVGVLAGFLATNLASLRPKECARRILAGLDDAGRGLVIIGVLLAGAQILVSMINLTGVGVTLSSMIVAYTGDSTFLIGVIVGGVCLVMGMGLPTTAAYVLVAAVLAPAMVESGIDPLASHMFVFYFATLSVITPPVCVAVFVAAGIARTNWLPAAFEAVRLAALVYFVPFLMLLYPGLVGQGGALAVIEAGVTGAVLIVAVPGLLGGQPIIGNRSVDAVLFAVLAGLAVIPHWGALVAALGLLAVMYVLRRKRHMATVAGAGAA